MLALVEALSQSLSCWVLLLLLLLALLLLLLAVELALLLLLMTQEALRILSPLLQPLRRRVRVLTLSRDPILLPTFHQKLCSSISAL